MEKESVEFKRLTELIEILENSNLNEIEIEEDGLRIRLQKAGQVIAATVPGVAVQGPAGDAASQALSEPVAEDTSNQMTIDSPMVGTFYAAPAPGEPFFVNPDDAVDAEQIVCIIEAMKLMNEVGAKEACVIEAMLVENGHPVEFGQPLFRIRLRESA